MSRKRANKVLVYAVNEGLRRGAFTLTPGPVSCPREGFLFDIQGIPALVHFEDIGSDEISIKVTLWPTDAGRKHAHCVRFGKSRAQAGGFYSLGWFERRKGPWIMEGAKPYCARARRAEVDALTIPIPDGFEATGRGIL